MKLVGPMLIGLLAAACASPVPTAEPTAEGSAAIAPASSVIASATPEDTPVTAIELLQCDAAPSDVGGSDESLAFDGGGSTPDRALETFLASTVFVIPRTGYELLGQSGDRYAYGYRAGGEVKVVLVISPRFADLVDAAFTADELRTCPEAEFGSDAEFADGRRVWTHAETGAIVTDIAGPEHCGWESARMMHIEEDGVLSKQYLRDPEGVFDQVPLRETYAEDVELPDDAADTGYRSPEGYELWFTESDTAAYVATPDGVERWPRPVEIIGCA
jgi:hypothetical protein